MPNSKFTLEDVCRIASEELSGYFGKNTTIREDEPLHTYGADSLDVTELCLRLEYDYDLSIPPEVWNNTNLTCKELYEAVVDGRKSKNRTKKKQ